MLTIVLWKWNDKRWPTRYKAEHVNTMAAMISRNLKVPHRIICVTDDDRGIDQDIGIMPLWDDLSDIGKCYRRLKAFDKSLSKQFGERFLSLDLDSVVVNDLTGLLDGIENVTFKAAKDTQPPTPYNGSMFYLKSGFHSDVWDTFDPDIAPALAARKGYCACDQAWMGVVLGENMPVWTQNDGVKSFRNDVIQKQSGILDPNDRIVFFHGNRKPWEPEVQARFPWIPTHYKDGRKRLVVIGGAPCFESDLARYAPPSDCKVMVINDQGCSFPGRIDYWVTLHPEKMHQWQAKRRENDRLNQDYITITYDRPNPQARIDKMTGDWGGSSGLFACKVGLEEGFDHIVLCGIPMDSTPNVFRPGEKVWAEFKAFRTAWVERADDIRGKVFSMSGWTRELLSLK